MRCQLPIVCDTEQENKHKKAKQHDNGANITFTQCLGSKKAEDMTSEQGLGLGFIACVFLLQNNF